MKLIAPTISVNDGFSLRRVYLFVWSSALDLFFISIGQYALNLFSN